MSFWKKFFEKESLSYHDVVVYVDGVPFKIKDTYGLELSCTRVGGWQLWLRKSESECVLIGGEYEESSFSVVVGGIVVCVK